ncbi:MAG: alpha/beta hydrolase [Bdellovibrionales bacterium]|nr:alpha/beta hydrolase [Bdellovibrionales bacterium]
MSHRYQINYELKENTVPVDMLFLHGNLASRRWWYPVSSILTEKNRSSSPQGSMALCDIRGYGGSSGLPQGYQMTADDLVMDFITFIETHKLKNVLLVAHSAGTPLAALMLARRPELFLGGILIGSPRPQGVSFEDDLFAKYEFMASNRELTRWAIGSSIHKNDYSAQFFNEVLVEDAWQGLQKGGSQIARAVRDLDISAEVASIQKPVLILHGLHDHLIPESHAADLHRAIPNSTLTYLPDNGHCLNVEDPMRLADEIDAFVCNFLK